MELGLARLRLMATPRQSSLCASLKRRLVEAAGVEPVLLHKILYYFNMLIIYRTTCEQLFLFFNPFLVD
jgi:hypothetical protein